MHMSRHRWNASERFPDDAYAIGRSLLGAAACLPALTSCFSARALSLLSMPSPLLRVARGRTCSSLVRYYIAPIVYRATFATSSAPLFIILS